MKYNIKHAYLYHFPNSNPYFLMMSVKIRFIYTKSLLFIH